jgi:Microtubule associated protein (MAP65/ASE1 family)
MELRRENMHIFVDAARENLQGLWDDLFYSEEQMAEFTPAFTGMSSLGETIPNSRYIHRCLTGCTRV